MLIAGDIGATKTNLGIYSRKKGARKPIAERTFTSKHYESLEAIVEEFLESVSVAVDDAAFGIAGPVIGSQVKTTNLPWMVSEEKIAKKLKVKRVYLINDLEAVAYSVPLLHEDDLFVLNKGKAVEEGAIGVIAPGTGLGEAFLTFDGARYRAHASEGGHADFGPTGEIESNLLKYMSNKYDHVSYERVCSGMAIPDIYRFLRDAGGYDEEPGWLTDELSRVDDATPVIVRGALSEEKACAICTAAIEIFVSVLGAEAGNLALKVMATGGIYIGGGIPPRIIPLLKKSFPRAFINKGRYTDLMERIPVHVITNPKAALIGAAFYGLEAKAV